MTSFIHQVCGDITGANIPAWAVTATHNFFLGKQVVPSLEERMKQLLRHKNSNHTARSKS
jgi:hypothetical protein